VASKSVWKKGASMYFWCETKNGTWRKRYNYELHEIFNEPNTVNYIKVKRLAWARLLVTMHNDRTIKKIFNTKPDVARSVGRPKLRWEDGVDQDMRIIVVKNWRKVALNRDEWIQLLKKASPTSGCRANDDNDDIFIPLVFRYSHIKTYTFLSKWLMNLFHINT